MSITEAIGFIAAICTTISFLPQVIKVLKTRDTRALSLTMYMTFVFGVSMWLLYGLLQFDWPIIAANTFTLLLAGTILLLKIKNRKTDKLNNTETI